MSDASEPTDPSEQPGSPHLRARIPDHVAGGTFSSGAVVMTGPSEFVIDFLQTVGRPHRVAARVILPHPVMPQFIDALRKNLSLYEQRFGPAPRPEVPPQEGRRPSAQEIYDDLKLPDEMLSGVYSNGVMIGHGANEFSLDFLTSFFPQSAVSARVYLAAGQVPRLLDSLENAAGQLQQRRHPPEGGALPGTGVTNVMADPAGPESAPPASDDATPDQAGSNGESNDDDDDDGPSGPGLGDGPPGPSDTGPPPPSGGGGGKWV